MIAKGEKMIETRTWRTSYVGDLLIVSSRQPNDLGPAGVALCVVYLAGVVPMTGAHARRACCPPYPRAQAWILRNVRRLPRPFPVRGGLGLFILQEDTLAQVREQLEAVA